MAQEAYFSRSQQQPSGPAGPSPAFFAFPSGEFEERETGEYEASAVEKLGMSAIAVDRIKAESQGRLEAAAKDFWRHESM
jgi:hypothetical protein